MDKAGEYRSLSGGSSSPLRRGFGPQDSEWFSALSGDLNPLHRDAKYAALTPLGKPVLHGMAAALAGLGAWRRSAAPEKAAVALQYLRVQFRKPVFWGQELELRTTGNSERVVIIEWIRGESAYIRVEMQLSGSASAGELRPPFSLFPRSTARTAAESVRWQTESQLSQFKYAIDARMLQDPRSPLGEGAIAIRQLQVLAWASYFVGMEWPGAPALFVDCSFEFSEFSRSGASDPLTLDALKGEFDSRFGMWSLKGQSRDALFHIRSVERPQPVIYSSDLLKRSLPKDCTCWKKHVLITGGTRGFGSLLCRGFSELGARVWYTSRTPLTDQDVSAQAHGVAEGITADMADAASCLRMSNELLASGIDLDGVILNASPSISPNDWSDQEDEEALSFISKTSAMVLYPLRALLPRLKKHGFVIYISSEYVKKPGRHFAHYVAAKSAAEGLIRALAVEFPTNCFLIVRPPKMLTNQTNVAFDLKPPAKTELVAGQLLTELCRRTCLEQRSGLIELDLGFTG